MIDKPTQCKYCQNITYIFKKFGSYRLLKAEYAREPLVRTANTENFRANSPLYAEKRQKADDILEEKKVFVTVRAKSILAVVLVIALAVICCIGLNFEAVADVYNNASSRKLPVYGVDCGEEKKVALTFDAAWGADKTQGILDALEEYGATATFFLVGFWVDDYPDMVKAIDQSGCEIGNHSKNHLHMSKLSVEEISMELDYVSDKVETLTGKRPSYFRPPYGEYDNKLIEGVESVGMQAIQWSVDSLDWKGLNAQEILSRVTKGVKNGSIILFHNNSDHILDALPLVLAYLQSEGYKTVTMSELVYKDNYYIDNNGVQHMNAEEVI